MSAPTHRPSRIPVVVRTGIAPLMLAVLAGCATPDPDAAFAPVAQAARDRLGQDVLWIRSDEDRAAVDGRVRDLLAKPLDAEAAVQVALLNHRGLQAAFHALGIADADRVRAGRLPNPRIEFARLTRGDEIEREVSVQVGLARLLAMPVAGPLEAARLAQVRAQTTATMLAVAGDARRAWIDAVAAEESVRYRRQVRDAADASAELARRMARVGNFTKLQRAREEGFRADALTALARAEQASRVAHERLIRRLGLWGEQTEFSLPERLPDLPPAPDDLPDVERTALATRLDVRAAALGVERTARSLGLTRAVRFVDAMEIGAVRSTSNEAPTQRGGSIGLELPLFDWGESRVARAEAVYRQAAERAASIAIDARSEVREAYTGYRAAWDLARYWRDEVVPLRQRIADENLLRYNGMLIGVFDLLADARAQVAGVHGYLDALHDFWLARAALDRALVGAPQNLTPDDPR